MMFVYPCAVDGVETRVADTGTGDEVLVFIHGMGARADRWRRNLRPLGEAGYRCVAFDLPGHGFADKGGDFPYGVPGWADFTGGVLKELGIERAVLIGTSLGGFIATHLACAQPGLARALVLVGTLGIVPMGGEARVALGARFANVTREGVETKLRTVLHDDAAHVTPGWIDEEWRINNSLGARAAFAAIADYVKSGIDDDVVGPFLASLTDRPPVAIVWGREDRAVPVTTGQAARDLLSPELYVEIPDTGHCPYFENPEAFHETLLSFIKSLPDEANPNPRNIS